LSSLVFHSQNETEAFARDLALWIRPGFVILLQGDLGAGKSTLARALIRSLAPDQPDLEVPSPSFALLNTYENTRIPIVHADFYRLTDAASIDELGLTDLVRDHAIIIEWPALLASPLSDNVLTITLSGHGDSRMAVLHFKGAWHAAWTRHREIANFLQGAGFGAATRVFLEGDASSRRYEKLITRERQTILMDMPLRPDGPPVRDGKPYSAIAHLAEGLAAVVGVNQQLITRGYTAPQIYAYDLDLGLAIIENLGTKVYGRMRANGENMVAPMRAAVEVLADMACKEWPRRNIIDDQHDRIVPDYDADAMLIEVDLILSWFYPHIKTATAPVHLADEFAAHWRKLFSHLVTDQPVWVMRDYHSPNLLWLPDQTGLKRVGIIDSQDAVIGHPAYDLVSLLQDARLDIPADEVQMLYRHYETQRQLCGAFDAEAFKLAYAILGAQRATKILGIFARLAKRDGKPDYLRHIPRVQNYLRHNLQHPQLATLKQWYEMNLPEALGAKAK
jgi:N-acetylmuramate 1-kinase